MVLPPQTEGIAAKSVRWVSRARIFWEDGPPRTLSVNSWEAEEAINVGGTLCVV